MDGRTDFFFGMERVTSLKLGTCHRRYTKKNTPNLTAQVENIGGKINYRATFTYHHITRQDQKGKGPACEKRCPSIQILPAVGICLPTYRRCFLKFSCEVIAVL